MPLTNELTIWHMGQANAVRTRRWHPGFPLDTEWGSSDWSTALAGEVGEVCGVIKMMRRLEGGHQEVKRTREELLEHLGDEIADVILYADLLATKHGLDLEECIVKKFNKTSIKWGYPDRL